jgi:hypothetical protein
VKRLTHLLCCRRYSLGRGAISIVAGELALDNRANVLAGSCVSPACDRAGAVAGGGIDVMVGGFLTIDFRGVPRYGCQRYRNAGNVSVMVAVRVVIERPNAQPGPEAIEATSAIQTTAYFRLRCS